MYQLEACRPEQIESGLSVTRVIEKSRATFGQPFVIEGADCVKPMRTLIERFPS
jgi:hypothetical protein